MVLLIDPLFVLNDVIDTIKIFNILQHLKTFYNRVCSPLTLAIAVHLCLVGALK